VLTKFQTSRASQCTAVLAVSLLFAGFAALLLTPNSLR
jgi:hypothetical protein